MAEHRDVHAAAPTAAPADADVDFTRVHLIGIGGAGMSGLARILLARGASVSGSDAKDAVVLSALRALGARIEVGHDPAHLGDAVTVVVSSAIRESNPELVQAHRRGLRVLRRASALAALMAGSRGVAIAGTHGKTTTTSMLTVAVQHCGADPSFAIGGDLNEAGSNAHQGSGTLFVAEADESDGSFLLLSPYGAIVTNVEPDHLDYYGTTAAVEAAFGDFVRCIDPDGFLVLCADDPGAAALAAPARERGISVRLYGETEGADTLLAGLVLDGVQSRFTPVVAGQRMPEVRLRVPGRHNALNAAAALSAGLALGFTADELIEGLVSYTGVRRRFELKGEAGGVRVFDCYAHHPTEIVADLRAAREVAGDGALVVVFQPHLYSRTATFAKEFGQALGLADEVVVMEVYGARESPLPGVSGRSVAAAVPLPASRVAFEPSWSAVPALLAARARPGDLVLTIGAGDVTMLAGEILDLLAARPA